MNRRAGLALGWAGVASVVYLSLMPSPPQIGVAGSDKVEHFLAYALLAFWFSQFYFGRTRAFYALGLVALGVAIEFVQRETGYRTFEIADMVADALGVAAGCAAARFVPLGFPRT